MIVKVLLCLIYAVAAWDQSNIFESFAQKVNLTLFKGYLLAKTVTLGTDYLLIFGGQGYDKSTYSAKAFSSLYRINLATREVTELALNGAKPSPRHNVCGAVIRDRLIIYGGYLEDHSMSNELWQYEILNDRWSMRGTAEMLEKCSFMTMTSLYDNDTATIMGLIQYSRKLCFFQYNIFNKSILENTTLKYKTSISTNTKLWDGTIAKTYLRLQKETDLTGNQVFEGQDLMHLPMKYFCLYNLSYNTYSMVTNNGVYSVAKEGLIYTLGFVKRRKIQEIDRLDCLNTKEWLFQIYTVNQQPQSLKYISIQYSHIPSSTQGVIHKQKKSFYTDWLPPVQCFSPVPSISSMNLMIIDLSVERQCFHTFVVNRSIFIVNQYMQTYQLSENCGNFTVLNVNVKKCTYGMYSCKEGWTGKTCDIPQCGASLRIYDKNLLAPINIECSGNGECTETGCKCKQNWGGTNCEIYNKKGCEGTLIQNFIESNCQCNQPTTGGNECTVVFCYNDCAGQGQCQADGSCKCKEGYKGPDCSILEINFERIG